MGQAVIFSDKRNIIKPWGNPDEIILPRSSCKMIRVLPLITSGASEDFSLNMHHLALACASHQGVNIHTYLVIDWLENLGLRVSDFH